MPSVRVQKTAGYSRRETDEIVRITKAHREEWLGAWREYFGDD